MKVTLISPVPSTEMVDCYGMRILSSCLKRDGCDVKIIFLPRNVGEMYEEQTVKEIIELTSGSDLTGISLMTDDFSNAVLITQKLKQNLKIPIIWGGIHPTVKPLECLEHVEMICMGEGEESLVELVKRIKTGQNFFDIQGMWFKNKGEIIKNKLRPLIQDLDMVPFPDNDLNNHYVLVKNHYLKVKKHICRIDDNLLKNIWSRCYMTLASRGCPFSCTYCWNHVNKRMYAGQQIIRKRSNDNLIEELKIAKNRLPFVQAIDLNDDLFFVRTKEEIIDFGKKYKENIQLPLWIGGAFPSELTREKLSVLVEAGLTDIRMGIQTASERTKKLYRRYYSNQDVENTVSTINEFKDKIKLPIYDIILDNPWETEDDIIETLMFLSKLPVPFQLNIFTLTLYPGTDLYEKAKNDGLLLNSSEDTWKKKHHIPKKSYLNKLFFLMRHYVPFVHILSPHVMFFLTNRKLRNLRISQCLYIILKTGGIVSFWMRYYLVEGYKEMRRSNYSRIIRFGKRFYNTQKHKIFKN